MKKLYSLLPLFFVLNSFSQTIHYISPTGTDAPTGGTLTNPWKTLSYACANVSTIGDVIYVNPGTYVENNQCTLAAGVSITGQDTIVCHIQLNYWITGSNSGGAIMMISGAVTNANQSISKLWFDVKDSVNIGFVIKLRSNVVIHDCKFTNFRACAMRFGNSGSPGTPPANYCMGNQFYNNITYNSSDRTYSGPGGVVGIDGQDGMLIHDNKFHQDAAALRHNGDVIGGVTGYNKNISYYNNESWKPVTDSSFGPLGSNGPGFNCTLELWYSYNWQIYSNIFHNGGDAIDIAFDGRNFNIHDNQFIGAFQPPTYGYGSASMGVQFETEADTLAGYSLIEHNTFINIASPLQITMTHGPNVGESKYERLQNIHFDRNLIENAGYADGGFGGFIINLQLHDGDPINWTGIDSIWVDNNTIISGTGSTGSGRSRAGLFLGAYNSRMKHIYYRNNIIDNTASYGALTFDGSGNGAIDSLFYQNNLAYNNTNLTFTRPDVDSATKLDVGVQYSITTVGNTDFTLLGASSNTVGIVFTATGKAPKGQTGIATTTPPNVTHYTNSGTLTSNPILNTDFTLQVGSPAINAGINVGYGTDIGAFSYTAVQENLLSYSEDLTNAVWIHSAAITITPDDIIAPDCKLTADKITTTNGYDNLYQTVVVSPNTTYTFSFYAKKGTIGSTDYNVQINNIGGASITTKVDYSGSINNTTWTRISVTFTTDASTTKIIVLPKNDGGSAGTLWIWGAQLNRGASAGTYVPTLGTATVQENLVNYSEDLSNAVWTHSGTISIITNDIAAPDGNMTADRITTSTGYDNLYETVSVSPGTTYTLSFYAKKGTISAADYNVQINNIGGVSITSKVNYAGLINTTTWTRVSVTFITDASTNQIIVLPKNDGGSAGTLWIWGVQLNRGSSPATYIKTPTTTVTQQNKLKYSEDLTNSVWLHSSAISFTANDIAAPDGTVTADKITTTTGYDNLYQTAAVSPSTTYTLSFYAKKGTIGAADYNVQINNIAGASITTKVDYSGVINTTSWTRVSVTFTTDASTNQIIVLPKNDGGSAGTLWIWGVQLNAGSAAACYIKTTSTGIGYEPDEPSISNTEPASKIRAYPNPFNNSFRISINGALADKVKLTLLNADGKIIWNHSLILQLKNYEESVNSSKLAKGVYFLKGIQNNISTVVKLVKQ